MQGNLLPKIFLNLHFKKLFKLDMSTLIMATIKQSALKISALTQNICTLCIQNEYFQNVCTPKMSKVKMSALAMNGLKMPNSKISWILGGCDVGVVHAPQPERGGHSRVEGRGLRVPGNFGNRAEEVRKVERKASVSCFSLDSYNEIIQRGQY